MERMTMRRRLPAALVVAAVVIVGSGGVVAATDGRGPGRGRRILIADAALVLTMDPSGGEGLLGAIPGGDVLIDGDRIAAVGRDLPRRGARVVDGRERIVLPGFVDTHNHLWQTLIRGCGSDAALAGWLERCVLPLYRSAVSEGDGYAGARLGALDVVSTGVTTVADWSHAFNAGFARGNLRALTESGLRFVFAYSANARTETLDEIRRVKQRSIDPNPLARLQVAVHPTTANFAATNAAQRLASELGVALNVHLHESPADPATGQLDALRQAGAIRPGLVTNHTVQMTDAELDELAAHDARVTHNPLSNLRLASGVARLPAMHARAMHVGLGLDGGTNDTSDMFATMKAAVGLQRAQSHDPASFPTIADVLRMATLGGAEVLGLDHLTGSLTPGKQADVVVIDPRSANFAPRVDLVSQIVLCAQPPNVEWVFAAGRILRRHGRTLGDTRRITADAQAASERIGRLLTAPATSTGRAAERLPAARGTAPAVKAM